MSGFLSFFFRCLKCLENVFLSFFMLGRELLFKGMLILLGA